MKLTEFLAAFFPDEDEAVYLRAFKAKGEPDAPNNRPLVEVVTRRVLADNAEMQNKMIAANETRGWYFVVNAGGNTDADITRFNAVFVEIDDLPLDEQHRRFDASPLQPSIRLETRKSVHAYWLIDGDCTEAEWRDIQARLIAYFGGDEKIKNPARVMRLPYFNHLHYNAQTHKHETKRVELVAFIPERRYSSMAMCAAFPAPSLQATPSPDNPPNNNVGCAVFVSWDELHAETARRIRQSPKARADQNGWTHAPGVCHGSTEGKALYVSPDGAYGCHKGCSTANVRAV
jgi:putative DNA primase/helicase